MGTAKAWFDAKKIENYSENKFVILNMLKNETGILRGFFY